tara:strand:+ start:3479 stop:6538 length:3060 start_codon:yes stop_codon:yes gene_type:complete
MKSRKPILYLAITFALVCLYQLSFTWKVNNIDEAAIDYALSQIDINQSDEILALDSVVTDSIQRTLEVKKINENYLNNRDIILENLEREYIKKESINEDGSPKDIFMGMYTYQECKEREINLGLDLKGGMNVTLEVSVKDVLVSLSGKSKDTTFRRALKNAEKNLENSQTAFVELFADEFNPEGNELASIFGTRTLREKVQSKNNAEVIKVINSEVNDAIESSFEILRSRIDRFGVTQPNIQKTNVPGRIIVELPGIKDPDRAKKLLQSSAQLEFWETFEFSEVFEDIQLANSYLAARNGFVKDTTDNDSTFNANENPWFAVCGIPQGFTGQGPVVGYTALKDTATVNSYINDEGFMSNFNPDLKFVFAFNPGDDSKQSFMLLALKKKGSNGYVMDGGVITDAQQVIDNGEVKVSMAMNADGANIWRATTGSNKGRSIAIVLDGYAKSWPTVNDEIPNGRSEISGNFTVNEGQDLANVLKSGKLPAPAHITQEAIIGPSLGQDSIDSGLKSFMIALLFVLVYMIFYYYGAGTVSNVALLANIFFIFGVLSSLGAVLTLPGIAGIVLTIGMSVDANVLIYERIREELANGKGVRLAIEDGYKSAYSSIIDANVTTLLTGIILFSFGTGPIKGFATTLIIGIITSLFSAIFITRLIISSRMNKGKSMSFSIKLTHGAFKNLNVDFIGKRKIFYILSSILILFGGYSLTTKGLNYGIDFVGGRTYVVSFDMGNGPCKKCENEQWKWGETGDCQYDTKVECEQVNTVNKDDVKNGLTSVFNGQAPSVSAFNLKGQAGEQLKITTKYRIDENTLEADNDVKSKLFEGLDKMNYSYTVESQEKVGPTIADDIRDAALWSVIFSLIVIFLYILIRFKKWQFSLGAVVAVFHDVLLVLSVFSILYGAMPFSLEIDQAFIAAILTIIGYSLNDTVVVFDRVREYMESYKKKEIHEYMNKSLNSTLSRTINTSLTTFVVLLVIFLFGGEAIKGFMFALMIGVIVGTYSSLFVASPIMLDTIKRKAIKSK